MSGAAYLTYTPTSGPAAFLPQFYTVDLGTGAASLVGTIGDGRTPLPVIGISVAPEVIPEPTTLLLVGTGLLGAARRREGGAKRARAPEHETARIKQSAQLPGHPRATLRSRVARL